MEENTNSRNSKKGSFTARLRDNFIWIIFVFIAWYIFIGAIIAVPYQLIVESLKDRISSGMYFTLDCYSVTLFFILTLFILTWAVRKNRYIWKSFLLPSQSAAVHTAAPPSGLPDGLERSDESAGLDVLNGLEVPEDTDESEWTYGFIQAGREDRSTVMGEMPDADDIRAELYGRSNNSFRMLGIGILLGFLTNFFCILLALIHGDIRLYFDASLSQLPFFIFALVCVCIQSSSEELWCRGFLYERLHRRYPLWVSIAVNGVLFGLLHMFNPGVSALPIASIVVCGISYSLLRWYTGNIWIAMGIHTGWNFTQNYLFGLPNSGLVSEASLFHLDAATGMSNLIYDYGFGVEGGLPAVFIDALLGIICLVLAAKTGRLGELGLNSQQTLELKGISIED